MKIDWRRPRKGPFWQAATPWLSWDQIMVKSGTNDDWGGSVLCSDDLFQLDWEIGMSKSAADKHRQAAELHETAAEHHKNAAEAHESGDHAEAKDHSHEAQGKAADAVAAGTEAHEASNEAGKTG